MKIETRKSAKRKMLSVTCDRDHAGRTYQSEMVINNDIPYLLRAVRGQVDGRDMLLYDLSGYTALDEYLKGKSADSGFYRKLMLSLSGAFDEIDGFLLSRECMLISRGTIFVSDETEELRFLCFPYESSDTERALNDLSEFLLSKLDNTDKNAVTMGHRFFRLCMKKEVTSDALRKAVVIPDAVETAQLPELPTETEEKERASERRKTSFVLKKAMFSLIGAEMKEDTF